MEAQIAVVDDQAILCELLVQALRAEGFPACAYTSGRACLRAMQAGFRPRLILLDLHLPDLSGGEFAHWVREHLPGGRDVDIWILSGSSLPADYPARCGAQGMLSKPFDLREVLEIAAAATDPLSVPPPTPARRAAGSA